MAAEPIVAHDEGADGEVHGRSVSSWREAFSNVYIFHVEYIEIDPADDEACSFLERIGLAVQTDGTWHFVRRPGNFDDTVLKIASILLPGSETLRRLRILLRAKLEPMTLLNMLMKIADESRPEEYMVYHDRVDVAAFEAAVAAVLDG